MPMIFYNFNLYALTYEVKNVLFYLSFLMWLGTFYDFRELEEW